MGDDKTAAGPPPIDPRRSSTLPERIGPWRVLDVIGEGGMGVVYLAEQKDALRRRAAVKVIKLGMDSKRVLARFDAERRALAMMEHSNIATVFDAGLTDSGQPWFAMEYVKGIPITDYCDQNKLTLEERIALFQGVCSGVQHAHMKGVMHRDLKPSNVLVTVQDGRPVPKIIDFGLAKATDHHLIEATLFTEQGQVLGTPEYMSPEQAGLGGLDVDTRTDIYSLGVLLYELLVGALPFARQELLAQGYLEMQRVIREQEPVKPSTRITTLGELATPHAQARRLDAGDLRRKLRGDLDWIVLKALEKDRTRRYDTALELAADLGRHLRDEPVLASPPDLGYRVRKFARRYRGQLVAVGMLLASLAAGLTTTTWFWFDARTQAELAKQETEKAQRQEQLANDNAAAAELRREEAQRERAAKEKALAATEGALRSETGLRLVAHAMLQVAEDPGLAVALAVAGHERSPGAEAERALRSALAACRESATALIWEAGAERGACLANADLSAVAVTRFPQRGEATVLFPGAEVRRSTFACNVKERAPGEPERIALSGDGRLFAVLAPDAVQIHRTDTGAVVREWPAAPKSVTAMAFADDAEHLLVGTRDGALTMTAATGEPVTLVEKGKEIELVQCATRAPRALVSVGTRWEVWDLATKQRLGSFDRPQQAAPRADTGSGIAPDGSRATVWDGYSGVVEVWDAVRGKQTLQDPSQKVRTPAACWAIDPAGRWLALGCYLGVVKLHDLDDLTVHTIPCVDGDPMSVAFDRDGSRLAVGTSAGTIRVLDRATRRELVVLRGHERSVYRVSFSAADELTSLGGDGTVRRWVLTDPVGRRSLTPPELHRLLDVFSPVDGSTFELVKGVAASREQVSPAVVFRELNFIQGTGDPVFHIRWMRWGSSFSPDGSHLVAERLAGRTSQASLYDVASLRVVRELELKRPVFTPDGRSLAGSTGDGLALLALAPDANAIELADSRGYIAPRFRADGRQVIAMWQKREPVQPSDTVRVWDTDSGRVAGTFDAGGEVLASAVISADGECVAAGGVRGSVVLWDAKTGQRRATLAGHDKTVYALAFGPGDRLLASGGRDGTVRVWDPATARCVAVIHGDNSPVLAVAFSDDGKWVLYGTVGGTVAAEPIDALAFVAARRLRSLTPAERAKFAVGSDEERAAQDALWRKRAGLPEPR
ncbi:MAG TPA: protein kinase [Planctomycetota bacterium]